MSGRNLPPDTSREISGLKKRVTDLERLLDRIRRAAATTDSAPTDGGALSRIYVARPGSGGSGGGATWTDSLHPIRGFVVRSPDPTGRISLVPVDPGEPDVGIGDAIMFGEAAHGHWFEMTARVNAETLPAGVEAHIELRRQSGNIGAWPDPASAGVDDHTHWYLYSSTGVRSWYPQGTVMIRAITGLKYWLSVNLPDAGTYAGVEWWVSEFGPPPPL